MNNQTIDLVKMDKGTKLHCNKYEFGYPETRCGIYHGEHLLTTSKTHNYPDSDLKGLMDCELLCKKCFRNF